MTNRDPHHYDRSPQEWGLGATVAGLSVAFVVLVFVLMYGMSNQSAPTRSEPITTGQGNSPPAAVTR
jgi:hypothetical protein